MRFSVTRGSFRPDVKLIRRMLSKDASEKSPTLPPILMEVENRVLEDVLSLQMGYFSLNPWIHGRKGSFSHNHRS